MKNSIKKGLIFCVIAITVSSCGSKDKVNDELDIETDKTSSETTLTAPVDSSNNKDDISNIKETSNDIEVVLPAYEEGEVPELEIDNKKDPNIPKNIKTMEGGFDYLIEKSEFEEDSKTKKED